MPQQPDEELFLAFQRDRDHDALGTLFRRRADELLRLAVFLAPRPTEAEDLLQATFLSAIARAETYRPGHRVMSWLCGILTNHARMLRRSERRSTPEKPGDTDGDTPVDAALQQELQQALRDGISGLKEPYRTVLHCHLQRGLNSQEIGRELNQKPATIRKQMARALEKLRAVLPAGLATGVALRMSPAQIAERATGAAQFIGGDGVPVAFDGEDDVLPDGVPTSMVAPWLTKGLAAALMLTAAIAASVLPWPPETPPPAADAPTPSANETAAAVTGSGPEAPPRTNSETTPRSGATAANLTVNVFDADGEPLPAIELLCVADDGTQLAYRVLAGRAARASTDATGEARFEGLARGRYHLSIPGSVSKGRVTIHDGEQQFTLRLPRRSRHSGYVTDPFGRPMPGAEVQLSETAGRSDLPAIVATTDASGRYDFTCALGDALICARHPDYSQSANRRLADGVELQLELEPRTENLQVAVVDEDGAAVPGAIVSLVPRSASTTFYSPSFLRADAGGRCTFLAATGRQASVLVQHPAFAAAAATVREGAEQITVKLAKAARATGVARRSDGSPLTGWEVIATVAGARTNEPVSSMLARRAKVDADGRFAFEELPRDLLNLRIVASYQFGNGPPLAGYVVAGRDVDTRRGDVADVELVAPQTEAIEGALRTPDGAPLAGYHVMAVPAIGIASHRMLRRRIAQTDANGRYRLPSVADDETYELGVYPPERWWPNKMTWPVAFAQARVGEPCVVVVDPSAEPDGRLTCQALLPNGAAAARATFELRHLGNQTPLTLPADQSGRATFDELTAGDYWLVVVAPAVGSRTFPVRVEQGRTNDLGVLQLEPPSKLSVRLTSADRARTSQLRVVAKNLVGDKFVSTRSDADGVARLRPLPPSSSKILVYGDAVAPVLLERALEPGQQWIDVEVQAANPVRISFPFALSENPFLINGPMHVRVFDDEDRLVLDDYLGATVRRGRFVMAVGLPAGDYRVRARALWNALGEATFTVVDGQPTALEVPLRL